MAALRHPVKPKTVKKRTKNSSGTRQTNVSKLSGIGGNPEALTAECAERRFRGQILMPNVGYGSKKKTKHTLPGSIRKFLVHSVKELEVLMMCNKSHCAEIAHDVSSKNRKPLWKEQFSWPSVTKPNARLCSGEK